MSLAVRRFLMDRQDSDCSAATMRWYKQKLSQLSEVTGVHQLDELSKDHLQAFTNDLRERGKSPAYVRGWHQVFRSLVGWARESGYAVHPSLVNERGSRGWFTIKKPIEVEMPVTVFSQRELDDIFEAAGNKRDVLLCKLLAGTGLRLSEALNLTVDDIRTDDDDAQVRVRLGKGRKGRTISISRRLERDVARYIEFDRPHVASDRLFVTSAGKPLSPSSAQAVMKRIAKRTDLHVHAHAFRHTYATDYLKRGGQTEMLRRILGHTSQKMMARYVHLSGADLGRNINELAAY